MVEWLNPLPSTNSFSAGGENGWSARSKEALVPLGEKVRASQAAGRTGAGIRARGHGPWSRAVLGAINNREGLADSFPREVTSGRVRARPHTRRLGLWYFDPR